MLKEQEVEKNTKPTLGDIKKFFRDLRLAITKGKIPSPFSEKDLANEMAEIITTIYKEKGWPPVVPLEKLYSAPDNTRVSEYVLRKYKTLQKEVADLGVIL